MPVDGTVTALHFDAVLAMGVVATAAGTVWVLDWTVRQKVRLASGHTGQLRGLAVSQDGRYVASAAEDGSVRVWSVDMKEQVMHFQVVNVNDAVCNCVAFSPDTQRCVAGYTDGGLRRALSGHPRCPAPLGPPVAVARRLKAVAHLCPTLALCP